MIYAARDHVYLEEENIFTDNVQPAEGTATQLVASGKALLGVSYQDEMTVALARNVPVIAVAAILQHNTSGFASPADRNIKKPADFEGRRYGGWGSEFETAMLKAVMKKYAANPSRIRMVNIGSADYFTAIKRDIDFAWIYRGWTGMEAETRGVKLDFIEMREMLPELDYYTPIIITSSKNLDANRELLVRTMRAISRGYNYAIVNPNHSAEVLLKAVPELDKDLVSRSQTWISRQYRAEAPLWGVMEAARWQNLADWLYTQGVLKKKPDMSGAFTNEFLTGKP